MVVPSTAPGLRDPRYRPCNPGLLELLLRLHCRLYRPCRVNLLEAHRMRMCIVICISFVASVL